MPRLIDADDLGIGKANPEAFIKPEYAYGWNAAIEAIKTAPTIDAAPMYHGRWESAEAKPRLIYSCSVCGEKWGYGAISHMNYCPNCGAKMDLGVE